MQEEKEQRKRAEEARLAAFEASIAELTNGTYEGSFLDGKRHGHGVRRYGNGDEYRGGWKEGKKSGSGSMNFADGSRYSGHFHQGSYHGHGEQVSARGHRYKGGWIGGKREGHGVYEWPDGARYEGEYWDGKEHGHGTRTFASGAVYVGEWRAGVMEGKGSYTYADGAQYQGTFSQDLRHGFGAWSSPRGDRFNGVWVHDVASRGEGLRIQAAKGSIYCGDIVDGDCHGFGVETFPQTREVYEGHWVHGTRQGHGRLRDGADLGGLGSRFEGSFHKGLPVSGLGKIIYPHGRGVARPRPEAGGWFAGSLLRGMRHGPGVLVYGSGDIYDGEWKSNLRHGFGFMVKGQLSYQGIWVYDEAGEEGAPVWEPYLELDAAILQERVREQVRGMRQTLALPYGSIEILCFRVPNEQLLSLLNGSLKPLLTELSALKSRESVMLAEDDPDTAAQIVAIRHQGKAVYTRAHELVQQRAWDALPHAAQVT